MIIPATRDGDVETVRRALARGDDPNERDTWRFTALMYAACDDEKEITKLLLDNGADTFLKDARAKTAYDMAKEKGHTEIMKMLPQFEINSVVGAGEDTLARLRRNITKRRPAMMA